MQHLAPQLARLSERRELVRDRVGIVLPLEHRRFDRVVTLDHDRQQRASQCDMFFEKRGNLCALDRVVNLLTQRGAWKTPQ